MMANIDMKMEGIVFNIQHFTVHDGPGIRTEVFLKGCPLRCKWCSNPESYKKSQEIGLYSTRCIGVSKCGYCIDVCPSSDTFIIEDDIVVGINKENCINCLECAAACPSNAIKLWGQKMSVEQVMAEIDKDKTIYKTSGGGVTLNGGEALVQWEFVLQVLQQCKMTNIHTCVESALHCDAEVVDEILPYTDLLITDIKHMNNDIHKQHTGVGNKLILKNIKKVVESGTPVIIRIPVIPEHNNSEENIRRTAEFIKDELNNQVKQVQLLRYRRLGEEKYKSLGLDYAMEDTEAPDVDDFTREIANWVELIKSYGIPAVFGSSSKIEL